jgi:hypothetical protein
VLSSLLCGYCALPDMLFQGLFIAFSPKVSLVRYKAKQPKQNASKQTEKKQKKRKKQKKPEKTLSFCKK